MSLASPRIKRSASQAISQKLGSLNRNLASSLRRGRRSHSAHTDLPPVREPEAGFHIVHTPDRPRHRLPLASLPSDNECYAHICAWQQGSEIGHRPRVLTDQNGEQDRAERLEDNPPVDLTAEDLLGARSEGINKDWYAVAPQHSNEQPRKGGEDASLACLPRYENEVDSFNAISVPRAQKNAEHVVDIEPSESWEDQQRRARLIARELYGRGFCPRCNRQYSDPGQCDRCGHSLRGYRYVPGTRPEDVTPAFQSPRTRDSPSRSQLARTPASSSHRHPTTMASQPPQGRGWPDGPRTHKSEDELSEDEIHINAVSRRWSVAPNSGVSTHIQPQTRESLADMHMTGPMDAATMAAEYPAWAGVHELSPSQPLQPHFGSFSRPRTPRHIAHAQVDASPPQEETVRFSRTMPRRRVQLATEPVLAGESARIDDVRAMPRSMPLSKLHPQYEKWEKWRSPAQQVEAQRLIQENGDDALLFEEIYACYQDESDGLAPVPEPEGMACAI